MTSRRSTESIALEARLLATARDAGARDAQWEASVRGGAGAISGGRMMIERASVEVARALWDAVGLPASGELERLAQVAEASSVPLIVGWDLGDAAPLLKLYVNASDASHRARAAIAHEIGWAGLDALPEPPHLVAVNASTSGCERKAYLQRASWQPSPSDAEAVHWLDGLVRDADASAGVVTSWDIPAHGEARARAFFVALRGDDERRNESILDRLPGWDAELVARALPFARGQCRSIGVDLRAPGRKWTAYFKQRGHGLALHALEPAARFGCRGHEIAVHVEPSEHTPRAYARTARWAISFRGERAVPRAISELLMRWAVERVRAGEAAGDPPERALALEAPPIPWTALHDDE